MNRRTCLYDHFHSVLLLGTVLFTISSIGLASPNTTPALKPVLGWNSFWPYGCGKHVREDGLRKQADAMAEKGLNAAGYKTLIVECGWEETAADDGTPTVKKRTFGDGLKPFSDYLNSKGLQLGLGTWGGSALCYRKEKKKRSFVYPIERKESHIEKKRDLSFNGKYIKTLVESGLTYLSHKPCDWATPPRLQDPGKAQELNARYVAMADGIRDAGAHIFYATGEWGVSPEAQNKRANSWAISDGTRDNWNSFIRILNALVPFAPKAGPGAYNDLGLLQLGNNKLSNTEKLAQVAFWAAAKSPLIMSTDLYSLDQYTIDMLKNPGMLAINQDDLGKSITFKRRYSGDMDIWSGPLADGSTVAVIINWAWEQSSKTIDLADLGFSSAHLFNVWTGKDLGTISKSYTTPFGMHGCLFLKLTETQPAPNRNFKRYPAETADVMGSAVLKQVNPTVKAVSLIAPNGKAGVRWNNVDGGPKGGNVLARIDFINADLSWGNTRDGKLNYKPTVITVNDKDKVYVDFPISGQTWEDIFTGFLVTLPLLAGESNKVLIEGLDDWAPDFVALEVEIPANAAT